MANDRLNKLVKYAEECRNKLSSPPAPKHVSHPQTYYEFWKRDLEATTKKIEDIRINEPAKK